MGFVAAKNFDPIVGVDIHMVLVPTPGGPVPTPLPHPFIGIVFDPIGAAIGGLISAIFSGGGALFVNGLPGANTGTDGRNLIKHFPTPPGTGFAPNDVPDNQGTIVIGSKTVHFQGSSAGRFSSMVSTCNFPLNVPTSMCLAVPAGSPVNIGGPDSLDVVAAITRGIRTKWFSDLLNKLLKPGPRLAKLICFLTGHPVDVMTGEVLTDAVDFTLPGLIPLTWERNYYSRSRYDGPLGPGWSHPLDVSLSEGTQQIRLRLADGRERRHDPLKPGESLWDPIDQYGLRRTKIGYLLTTVEGITYHLHPSPPGAPAPAAPLPLWLGDEDEKPADAVCASDVWPATHRLIKIADRCGNAVLLRYANGQLAQIADTAGRVLDVRSTPRGKLEGVYFEGKPLVRYEYDENGYLAAALDPLGHAMRYFYRASEKGAVLVRETNRNGLSFYFEYDWYDPDGWCTRTWGDGGIYDRRLRYDKHRHVTLVDDSRGGRTTYLGPRSGRAGLPDKVIDPTGCVTEYEWDPVCYRKRAETDGLGHRREWQYDARGNTVFERNATGGETRRSHDALDLPIEVVDPGGAAWAASYDDRGKLVRIVDPAGGETSYAHDRRGLLVQILDPLGRKRDFKYDESGNLVEASDDRGGCDRYAWDPLGRLIAATDALGRTSRLSWDACGRVVAALGADGATERRVYDPEGNVLERTDSLGHVWRYRYAGRNRLVEETNPLGGSIAFEHDNEEELTGLTNENGERYLIEADKAGRVTKESGFDGRKLAYRYDMAGRCHQTVSGTGKVTKIERDAEGRITRMLVPAAGKGTPLEPIPKPTEVSFGYDRRGALVLARNADAEVRFERDAMGRVVRETVSAREKEESRSIGEVTGSPSGARAGSDGEEASSNVVESQYDAADHRRRRATSLGHVAEFETDDRGLLAALSFGTDPRWMQFAASALEGAAVEPRKPLRAPWRMTVARDATGAEIERRMPGGVLSAWHHDRFGRPSIHRAIVGERPLFGRGYRWRTDEQIAALTDTALGATVLEHDARGYLVEAQGPDGVIQRRVPDAAGNLYRSRERTDRRYATGGIVTEADRVTYAHDKDGQLIEKCNREGRWSYAWDALGQLRTVKRPDGKTVELRYDALGRRISKRVGERLIRYVWDGDTLVHEVPEGAPLVTWVFEPDTFAPIAKAEGDTRYAVVTDHLGTPLAMVDEAGAVAWKAQLDLWGAIRTDVAQADCPWRWPGQYEDEETGLYYNRFRYYDPGLGRYISEDPIGLWGGRNLFAYVADPLRWADPFGLSESCGRDRFGPTNFRGLTQNMPLRELTHHQLFNAFQHTPFTPTNHAIMRLKDPRTFAIGIKTLNDVGAVLTKGVISDAGNGCIAIEKWGIKAIVDPISRRIVSLVPA